jgi:hypothetical protein
VDNGGNATGKRTNKPFSGKRCGIFLLALENLNFSQYSFVCRLIEDGRILVVVWQPVLMIDFDKLNCGDVIEKANAFALPASTMILKHGH